MRCQHAAHILVSRPRRALSREIVVAEVLQSHQLADPAPLRIPKHRPAVEWRRNIQEPDRIVAYLRPAAPRPGVRGPLHVAPGNQRIVRRWIILRRDLIHRTRFPLLVEPVRIQHFRASQVDAAA